MVQRSFGRVDASILAYYRFPGTWLLSQPMEKETNYRPRWRWVIPNATILSLITVLPWGLCHATVLSPMLRY